VDELIEKLKDSLLRGVALFDKLLEDFMKAGAPTDYDWMEAYHQLSN